MTDPDPPRRAGISTPQSAPTLRERRRYYLSVLCEDGYEHEFLASEILALYTGRTRGTYSPLCRQVAQPRTSPGPRAGKSCVNCARRRAAITPEPIRWIDSGPPLQVLVNYFR